MKIINSKGSNRSQGRNKAIEFTKNSIIAVTDAGCILKRDWLKKITNPIIKGEGKAVAGFYLTDASSPLACASAPFVATMPDRINLDNFLPSSRSIAFTKEVWEKVGKYPKNVDYCEDLLFASKIKNSYELIVQPNAIVYWDHFKSIKSYFRQIKNYASGDIKARYWPHLKKISTVFLRYFIFAFFPPFFFLYLLWPTFKHYRYIKNPSAIIYLPILQVITDAGIMLGSSKGFLKKQT